MNTLMQEYFLKVVEHMSYSKAAKELCVTQPSVSHQITNLENELGFQLFDRMNRNRITLTPAGQVFLESLLKARQEMEHAIGVGRELSSIGQTKYRVGFPIGWELADVIQDTQKDLEKQYPNIAIEYEMNTYSELRRKLDENELDLILLVQPGMDSLQGYDITTVNEVNMLMYFGKRHPLADPDNPQFSDFKEDPIYVLPEEETPHNEGTNHDFFMTHFLTPKSIMEPNRDTILLRLASGKGIAVFDSWMAYRRYNFLSYIKMDRVFPVWAVRKESHKMPAVQLFLNHMKELPTMLPEE